MVIHAVFENGVFRPLQPVNLPDACEVEFDLRVMPEAALKMPDSPAQQPIYDILSHRYETGDPYAAERHNEHHP